MTKRSVIKIPGNGVTTLIYEDTPDGRSVSLVTGEGQHEIEAIETDPYRWFAGLRVTDTIVLDQDALDRRRLMGGAITSVVDCLINED